MSKTPYTDSQKNRTAIIVLNWNAPEDTLSCLESLLPIIDNNLATMIVCDNDSDDDSVNIINQWAVLHFPHRVDNTADDAQFVLFQIESNAGYAAGNNVGIRYAIDNNFKYVWILNNDTVVEQDALATLVDYVEKYPQIACCGSTIVDYSEPNKLQCAAGCQYNPLSTVRTEIYHGCNLSWAQKQEKTIKLDYICGAAMFFNIDALRNIGLMNQQFFLYYEELDLAQRLKKNGYQLGWCKTSVVHHQQRSNNKVNEDQQKLLHYHENLSALIYTWIHHRSIFVFAATFRLIAKIIVLPFTNRIRLLPSLFKAYQHFYLHVCRAPQQQNKIASISNSLYLKSDQL